LPIARAEVQAIFTLAHLSDLHATPVAPGSLRPLLGKRLLGWLSWRLRRGATHRTEVLDALLEDLAVTSPDQLVITGDLTNVSLEEEFLVARDWLRRIGSPERVTAVPGNHDTYVRVPRACSWDLWSEYLESDAAGRALLGESQGGAYRGLAFPSVRIREPVALIGVSSAVPTPPFLASGRVGGQQLARLERVLSALAPTGLQRVVLIHHPPDPGATSPRRGLCDARALCDVLQRAGAEIVLHGHLHRTRIARIEGPHGSIPVVCARSASDIGTKPHKRAQYHVLAFEARDAGAGTARFRVTLRARSWDPQTQRFVESDRPETLLAGPA